MATGRVKFYNPEKGFGFLSQDDGGDDVHVRATALAAGIRELTRGTRVQFEVSTGPQGLRANAVRPLSADPRNTTAGESPRLSAAALDALITDLIAVLDNSVLPQLGKGIYPDPARSKNAAAMAHTVIHNLDPQSEKSESPDSTQIPRKAKTTNSRRAQARSATPRRSGGTPHRRHQPD